MGKTRKSGRRWRLLGAFSLLSGLVGCQTNIAGMTLPTPWYLQHPPQYFPPSPMFPLERELAGQEAVSAQPEPAAAAPLPPPVPAGGG